MISMRKMFIFLSLFLSLFIGGKSFAGDPVFYQDPYFYAKADRAPTATEPIAYAWTGDCCYYSWFDTSVTPNKEYRFLGGTNGSYAWGQVVTDQNITTWLPAVPMTKIYLGAISKTNVKYIAKSSTIAGGAGVAIFYLTDNALSGGAALCTSVYDETIDFEVNDSSSIYRTSWTLSGDKKTLTATTTRSTSTNVLLNLLGTLTSVLGAPTSAPNGTVVRATLLCD